MHGRSRSRLPKEYARLQFRSHSSSRICIVWKRSRRANDEHPTTGNRARGRHVLVAIAMVLALGVPQRAAMAQPIRLHPANPHYFLFRGRPTLLVTSGEHYGAVLNPDFDQRTYLQTLARDGLNYTRLFTGSYFEPQGAFGIRHNTMAPNGARALTPWARSGTPGYVAGGNKFDLSQWDTTYFRRLRDFV